MTPFSFVLLGWSGLKSLVKRPFKAPRALERVLRRGAADRIVPLAPDDLAALRGAGGCLACGRCDGVLAAAPSSAGPSDWILAGLRDLTDRDLAREPPADDGLLGRLEAVCPGHVPFRRLASSAGAMADRMAPRAGP